MNCEGNASGFADKIGRLSAIAANTTRGANDGNVLAGYEYNGAAMFVAENYPQPGVKLDLYGGTSGTYGGFDRFGRIAEQRWRTGGTDKDRFTYGHDYNSNRTYRQNEVARAANKKLDELYANDSLNRLTGFKRGHLASGEIATGGDRVKGQTWGLSQTGNWSTFGEDADGDGTNDLDQTRKHNKANEIYDATDAIGQGQGQTAWVDPVHDSHGNMTSVPRPWSPASAMTCIYDAWNRMVEAKIGNTTIQRNHFDGLNRREWYGVVGMVRGRSWCAGCDWASRRHCAANP
jgi:hypothetical protein